MLSGLPIPKANSAAITQLLFWPATIPNKDFSKPSNKLPSPTVKVTGGLSKLESIISPEANFKAKFKVTRVFSFIAIALSVILIAFHFIFCLLFNIGF